MQCFKALILLLFVCLTACFTDSDSSVPEDVTEKLKNQVSLDTALVTLSTWPSDPLWQIRKAIDLGGAGILVLPNVDTSLLNDCIKGAVTCTSEVGDGVDSVYALPKGDGYRSAVYASSPSLDSALDTSIDSSVRKIIAARLVLVRSKSISIPYKVSWGTTRTVTFKHATHADWDEYTFGGNNSTSSYPTPIATESKEFVVRSYPARQLWVHGKSSTADGKGNATSMEWSALDSGIVPGGDATTGQADIDWNATAGGMIAARLRFAGGGAQILRLQANKISGFDSISLENDSKIVLMLSTTKFSVYLHDPELRAPLMDSLVIEHVGLGSGRWKDARVHLSWASPVFGAAATDGKTVTFVSIQGIAVDGKSEEIRGSVILDADYKSKWLTYSSKKGV